MVLACVHLYIVRRGLYVGLQFMGPHVAVDIAGRK